MLFGDFMRIYEFCTQWLTLGILFFIIDYNTEWLQVVTLGGLVAGSMLIGFLATLLDRVGYSCACGLGGYSTIITTSHSWKSTAAEIVHKAIVLVGVLTGVYGLSLVMPGYTMEIDGPLVCFLLAYGYFSMGLGKILRRGA